MSLSECIHSFPIRVFWHGWVSDTLTLKQGGWHVFGHQEHSPYQQALDFTLGLRDPEATILIYGKFSVTVRDIMQGASVKSRLYHGGVEMQLMRATDRCFTHSVTSAEWSSMDAMLPIDGFLNVPDRLERPISELNLFKFTDQPKEIYIPQGSVDECLNRILQLQYPAQRELVKAEGNVVRPVMQAQIYSLAS